MKSIIENDDGKKTTRYNVYDASGALVYIVQRNNSDGSQSYNTIYAKMDGQSVARIKTTGWYGNYNDEITWLHHDHLGSAVAGTDESGNVAWTEKYTPYGISLMNDAANDNQAGFTGHVKDTDTGLTYMQARYYDPVVSRFLSHDPVQFSVEQPLFFNRYGYTFNNPTNLVDPDGECPSDSEIACPSEILVAPVETAKIFAEELATVKVKEHTTRKGDKSFLGGDKQAHFTANARASARGPVSEKMAELLSDGKEVVDQVLTPTEEKRLDSVEDQKTNQAGRDFGRKLRPIQAIPIIGPGLVKKLSRKASEKFTQENGYPKFTDEKDKE